MSDKKQETKQPEKSQSTQDKPKPYPLRIVENAEKPKDVINIEYSIEEKE